MKMLIVSPCFVFQLLPVYNAIPPNIFLSFMFSGSCPMAWRGQFYPHTVSNHPLRCFGWGFWSLLWRFQVWVNNETGKPCETILTDHTINWFKSAINKDFIWFNECIIRFYSISKARCSVCNILSSLKMNIKTIISDLKWILTTSWFNILQKIIDLRNCIFS
jgi:hypothetical protein